MWPIKTCLFFVGFVGACALSLAYPIVGVVNYILIYMMNPDKMWWGQALLPLGIRYSLTAAVCLILGMVISSGRVPRSRSFIGTWELLLITFSGVVVMSMMIGTGVSDSSLVLVDKYLKMTVFMLCLTCMASTMPNYRLVLWTLVIGSLLLGYDAFTAPYDDFADGRLNFVGGPDFRESSGLAAHMAAMLPMIGTVFLITRPWRWRIIALLSGILTFNTIVQCRTRSAYIGLLAAGLVALLLIPRTRRWRLYLVLGVGCVGAYSLTDNFFWARMSTLTQPSQYSKDAAISGRTELWQVALRMSADYPLGVGVGQFKNTIADYETDELAHAFSFPRRVTHNSYLLCLTELGVHGLAVLLCIIFISVRSAMRCFRLAPCNSRPRDTRIMAFGSILAMTAYLVTSLFTDRLYTESFWWILALPICMERAVVREIAMLEAMDESLPEHAHVPQLVSGGAILAHDSARCAFS